MSTTNDSTRQIIVESLISDIKNKHVDTSTVAQKIGEQMRQGNISDDHYAILVKEFKSHCYPSSIIDNGGIVSIWANPFFHNEQFKELVPSDKNYLRVWLAIAEAFKMGTEQTLRTTLFQYLLDYSKNTSDFGENMMTAFLIHDAQKAFGGNSINNDCARVLNELFLEPIYRLLVHQMMDSNIESEQYKYCVRNHSLPDLFLSYLQMHSDLPLPRLLEVVSQWTVCLSKYGGKIPFSSSTFKVSFEVMAQIFTKSTETINDKIEFVKKASEYLQDFEKYHIHILDWRAPGFKSGSVSKWFIDEINKAMPEKFVAAVATGEIYQVVAFTKTLCSDRALKKWIGGKSFNDLMSALMHLPRESELLSQAICSTEIWKTMTLAKAWEKVNQSRSEKLFDSLLSREKMNEHEMPADMWHVWLLYTRTKRMH